MVNTSIPFHSARAQSSFFQFKTRLTQPMAVSATLTTINDSSQHILSVTHEHLWMLGRITSDQLRVLIQTRKEAVA